MIKVNGEELIMGREMSLTELLKERGYKTFYVAVELNDEIIPRENFDKTFLKSGDVVEIVTFMGGGQIIK